MRREVGREGVHVPERDRDEDAQDTAIREAESGEERDALVDGQGRGPCFLEDLLEDLDGEQEMPCILLFDC